MSKRCTKCEIEKDETEFFFQNKKKNRLHAECKCCYKLSREKTYKEHYKNNKDIYIKRARERQLKINEINAETVFDFLQDKKCEHCGISDILVLEFHHRNKNEKYANISHLMINGGPINKVLEEMEKCDILCANCHRIETHKENNSYRYKYKCMHGRAV